MVCLGLLVLGAWPGLRGQELQIGIVDFYGLDRLRVDQVREALTFKEGDTFSLSTGTRPEFLSTSQVRLGALTGVADVHINIVCCEDGRAIVYVGILEDGATLMSFRPAPDGPPRLAAEIVRDGEAITKASMDAVRRGDAGEDDSEGHTLAHDPAVRAIQTRFIQFARRDLEMLRDVLRRSSDPTHRALAAKVIAYAADKPAVVSDLVEAMRDPDEATRNNAMRALTVFVMSSRRSSLRPALIVPYDPFIAFLHSPVWTDRNKASMALMILSETRDAEFLAKLRGDAMGPLVEMARWKSAGHAMPAFMILGRLAGRTDDEITSAWDRDTREDLIRAAVEGTR